MLFSYECSEPCFICENYYTDENYCENQYIPASKVKVSEKINELEKKLSSLSTRAFSPRFAWVRIEIIKDIEVMKKFIEFGEKEGGN